MDVDEVPEGGSALGLLEKHSSPYLGRLVILQLSNGLVSGSTQGPQAYLSRIVVKEPGQQEY